MFRIAGHKYVLDFIVLSLVQSNVISYLNEC